MDDAPGKRWERYEGSVVRFNFQEALDVIVRTVSVFDLKLAKKNWRYQ